MARYSDREPYVPAWHPEETQPNRPVIKKSRKKLWITLGILAFLFVGCTVAVAGTAPVAAPVPPAPVSSPAGGTLPAVPPDPNVGSGVEEDASTAPLATAAPPEVGPLTAFEDGGYEVGTDIAAGKYRSNGDTSICIAYVLPNSDTEYSIVKHKTITGEGAQNVTLKSGTYFKTSGCGEWKKIG